jgi:hypothetical protein
MQYQVAREELQSPPASMSWLTLLTEAVVLAVVAFGLVLALGI